MNITYVPHTGYSKEDWVKHGFLFLLVLFLSSLGLALTTIGSAEWVMSLIGFVSNFFVLGLAIYENRK